MDATEKHATGTREKANATGKVPAGGSAPRRELSPRAATALAALRVVIPILYVVGFYACAFYLSTRLVILVMGIMVLVACAWFVACLRVPDDRRTSHLARHGFIAKVCTLPLEIIVLMVYVSVFLVSPGMLHPWAWAMLVAVLYLGILCSSIYVIGAARGAFARGLISRAWLRAYVVCSLIPVADLVAGIFLWFALLRERLRGEEI